MLEIIKWIWQIQFRLQTVSNYWCQIDQFFWPEYIFLKGCFSSKMEDIAFAWFWPYCLYILWQYKKLKRLKNLKALEQRYWLNLSETESQLIFSKSFIPMWHLLFSWKQYLIHLFEFAIWFWISYSDLETKLSRYRQNMIDL